MFNYDASLHALTMVSVSVLVLTLFKMVLVLYFACTFNESTARLRHTHAPLDMHPLQAPLDIHPRHSPSALYFMIFATVVVSLLLLLFTIFMTKSGCSSNVSRVVPHARTTAKCPSCEVK